MSGTVNTSKRRLSSKLGRRRAVLLSPPGDLGQIVARSLVKLGFDVLLICEPKSSIRLSSLVSTRILVHPQVFCHADKVLEAIAHEHRIAPIDVVVGSSYPALAVLTGLKDELPCPIFPMSDLSLLERLNNKRSFAELCAEVGLPTPEALYFERHEDPDSEFLRRTLGYPCVLKPSDASGGDGVRIVADPQQLAAAVRDVRPFALNGYLAQTYVPGQDLGLSIFAVDGEIRNWATFHCDGFWSTRFVDDPDLLRAGRQLVRNIHFTGVANFDGRRDSRTGRLVMFECNPRFFRRVGASRHCGLDFVASGLAELGLVGPQAKKLTHGQHLSTRDLFSKDGIGLVSSGKYKVMSAYSDLVDIARDPVPSVGAAMNNLFHGMFTLGRSGRRSMPGV